MKMAEKTVNRPLGTGKVSPGDRETIVVNEKLVRLKKICVALPINPSFLISFVKCFIKNYHQPQTPLLLVMLSSLKDLICSLRNFSKIDKRVIIRESRGLIGTPKGI